MKIGYFRSCEEWDAHDLVAPDVDRAFFEAYRERVLPRVH
jgi:hypothetical protein